MHFNRLRDVIPVLFSLLLLGCSNSSEAVQAAPVKTKAAPKPAPDFTLKDADGRVVKLSDYRGKVVLLNFWATWCGPCKIEIPWFMEFEKKYKDQGFAVLGVAMDEDGWPVVKPYISDNKINYRILLGNDEVATLYGGVEALPTTVVLDRAGKIVGRHVGLVSKSEYEDEIKETLGAGRASNRGAPDSVARAAQ